VCNIVEKRFTFAISLCSCRVSVRVSMVSRVRDSVSVRIRVGVGMPVPQGWTSIGCLYFRYNIRCLHCKKRQLQASTMQSDCWLGFT